MSDELIGQFCPTLFGEWCRDKFDRFTADPHDTPDTGDFVKAEIVGYVQALPDDDANRPLLVMAVRAGDQINERSSRRRQFEFARKQLQSAVNKPPAKVKGLFTQGLFAFYDNAGAFRLSLISGRAEGKKLVYSDFKRQSFFVHPERNNKTFRARMASPFSTYESLAEAFSVEALTKEFYKSLFAWYERAMSPKSKVTFPNDLATHDDDRDLLAEHLIRLITRLMFVWFIRQKDLVPEQLFDQGALKKLLKEFDPESSKQDNYYRAILQNLFFATLNCDINERDFAVEGTKTENREHYGVKLLYRYADEFSCSQKDVIHLFRKVPFLNGGLFECLDKQRGDSARSPVLYHDGFSREPKKRAHIPNSLFFGESGLITLFDRYDFTVDENSPNDTDVALDPELLGIVFENLLGAYNPETQKTARKKSGSFYTPREIVNYMVDESLVAHIRAKIPEVEEKTMRLLLSQEEPPELQEAIRRKLVNAIYHCRILDPACGSGAFPMGLLLKMVHLLQRLDDKNALWREIVMAETEKALAEAENLAAAEKKERRKRITDTFESSINEPDYARKLYLIENCIFGVDIQPIAVQISKLRAFITLVCNQTPSKDPDKNYGMLPLPNLETKFVAANSLIGLSEDFADGLKPSEGGSRLDDSELMKLRDELAEIRHEHFRARTSQDKNCCRKKDKELRGKIETRLVEIASKPDETKIARFQTEIESLKKSRKAVEKEDWQEVVQSKPQQTSLFDPTPKSVQTKMRIDVNKEKRENCDHQIKRLTALIEAEQNRAKNKSAFQKEADRLADWDPYDQNASSPFFDSQWMFDVKSGFDTVIGNPPYIEFKKLDKQSKSIYEPIYASATGKYDIYVLFIEQAQRSLCSRGHLAFINPTTFLKKDFGAEIRKIIAREFTILKILDFADFQVFDGATNYTGIFIFEKETTKDYSFQYHKYNRLDRKTEGSAFAASLKVETSGEMKDVISVPSATLISESWDIQTSRVAELFARMNACGKPLNEFSESIFQGIASGKDEVFYVDSQTISEWGIEKAILLPLLKGQDIKRYAIAWSRQSVVYPYDNKSKVIYEKELKQTFPKAYEYLLANRKALRGRPYFDNSAKQWYELWNQRKKENFGRLRIVTPEISSRNNFALTKKFAGNTKTYHIVLKDNEEANYSYFLGLLNSRLLQFYFCSITVPMAGGFYAYKTQFLERLPICKTETPAKNAIVEKVTRIITAKESDPVADTSALEAEIDRLVYALYELTPEDIEIVEGKAEGDRKPITKDKPAKAAARKPKKTVLMEDPDLS